MFWWTLKLDLVLEPITVCQHGQLSVQQTVNNQLLLCLPYKSFPSCMRSWSGYKIFDSKQSSMDMQFFCRICINFSLKWFLLSFHSSQSLSVLKRTLQSLTQEVAAIFGHCALSHSPPSALSLLFVYSSLCNTEAFTNEQRYNSCIYFLFADNNSPKTMYSGYRGYLIIQTFWNNRTLSILPQRFMLGKLIRRAFKNSIKQLNCSNAIFSQQLLY